MLISGDTEKNATHKNFNKSNHATANNKIFIVDKLFFYAQTLHKISGLHSTELSFQYMF